MKDKEELERMFRHLTEAKEHAYYEHGHDMPPLLLTVWQERGVVQLPLAKACTFAADPLGMPGVIDALLAGAIGGIEAFANTAAEVILRGDRKSPAAFATLIGGFGTVAMCKAQEEAGIEYNEVLGDRLLEVWVGADAFHQTVEDTTPEEYRETKTISMGEDFATNPASTVKEGIIMTVFTDDRCGSIEMQGVSQTYAVTDGGRIAWDEVHHMADVTLEDGNDYGDIAKAVAGQMRLANAS
jgi:hypothetical protein